MSEPMRFQSLDEWLTWLEGHHPKEIDLGLERTREVARRMGLLEASAKVISVAGTNGKGSCVAACAALLESAGTRVGSYTSPHLLHYSERIRVQGLPASDAQICDAFARIDRASPDISLTYFEYGTLAALEVFRQCQVDVMVLEVGLGGRLDAVNILDADVAVVTSVDLDHQDWLGSDRDTIGREKAGIYRPGRPALCADSSPPEGLRAAARDSGVEVTFLGSDPALSDTGYQQDAASWRCWGWLGQRPGPDAARFEISGQGPALPPLPLPSLAAALQALACLGYDPVALNAAQRLSELSLPGRYQRLRCWGREFILDVAHNPAAARFLAGRLQAEGIRPRLALVAMMADKDRRATLAPLVPGVEAWWLASLPEFPRAASTDLLRADLKSLGAEPVGCGTVRAGFDWLVKHTQEGDQIVIMGSFFTVAAALRCLDSNAGTGSVDARGHR